MTDETLPERAKRSGVIIKALIDSDGRQSERRVRNLSVTGARIDPGADLTVGQQLGVSMGRLQGLVAQVVWVRDGQAGIHFEDEIDMDAARAPRGAGRAQAGWMTDINNAYRKPR